MRIDPPALGRLGQRVEIEDVRRLDPEDLLLRHQCGDRQIHRDLAHRGVSAQQYDRFAAGLGQKMTGVLKGEHGNKNSLRRGAACCAPAAD